MRVADLDFARPAHLQATRSPEARGITRDGVRLLVSTPEGHHHSAFANLANFLNPGDLLVVNRSATLPASLPAEGTFGPFLLNLSTRYGAGVWLAEPRPNVATPGPLPLGSGDAATVGGLRARFLAPYPGLPRLWFVRFEEGTSEGDAEEAVMEAMRRYGEPIRYGYLKKAQALEHYQTLFADTPGSAEMPSAARPFSQRVVRSLTDKGVRIAPLTLHTGVSSLELIQGDLADQTLPPEPFEVPATTARLVNATKAEGNRVIAVGTTVVRALETAWDGQKVTPSRGFTRLYIHPGRRVNVVNGLVSGFHDPEASHLAMLYAVAGPFLVRAAYGEAVRAGYLWHEFGDSHLMLP